MRLIISISAIIFLMSCYYYDDDKDLQFSSTHENLMKSYSEGDTIYFIANTGEMDTITISKIDTLQENGSLMTRSRREISIGIKHLPVNNWTGGTELYQDKPPKVLDQYLIVIEKIPDDRNEDYFIGINYRNFMGEIKDLSNIIKDNRFEKFGINEYWVIENDAANWPQYKNDTTLILTLYWTEMFGLTGYETRNGKLFEIKKNAL